MGRPISSTSNSVTWLREVESSANCRAAFHNVRLTWAVKSGVLGESRPDRYSSSATAQNYRCKSNDVALGMRLQLTAAYQGYTQPVSGPTYGYAQPASLPPTLPPADGYSQINIASGPPPAVPVTGTIWDYQQSPLLTPGLGNIRFHWSGGTAIAATKFVIAQNLTRLDFQRVLVCADTSTVNTVK